MGEPAVMNPFALAPASAGTEGGDTRFPPSPAMPVPNTGVSAPAHAAAMALRLSAALWCGVAVSGQLLFAVYVMLFYGRAAAAGRLQDWNRVLAVGYIPGSPYHNAILAAHLLFAEAVLLSGALQLLPAIRRHWPRLHRWSGRFFVFGAMIAAASGLTMVLTTGAVGDFSQHLAVSLNALLVFAFASLAMGHAMARHFDTHRRWALRLFLAANGVWFFRIGLTLWLALNRGPAGFDPKTFTGPFLTLLSFAQFLLPLLLLQLYFRAQNSHRIPAQWTMAATLLVLTLATASGTATAAMMLWLPHL